MEDSRLVKEIGVGSLEMGAGVRGSPDSDRGADGCRL